MFVSGSTMNIRKYLTDLFRFLKPQMAHRPPSLYKFIQLSEKLINDNMHFNKKKKKFNNIFISLLPII